VQRLPLITAREQHTRKPTSFVYSPTCQSRATASGARQQANRWTITWRFKCSVRLSHL